MLRFCLCNLQSVKIIQKIGLENLYWWLKIGKGFIVKNIKISFFFSSNMESTSLFVTI